MSSLVSTIIQDFILMLPNLFWAIIVFIVGIFCSNKIGDMVALFLKKLKLDHAMKSLGWQSFLDNYDAKLNGSKFFGGIVKIFFILLFLLIVVDILNFSSFANILQIIITYFPNVFIACVMFVFGVFVADFSQKIIIGSSTKEGIRFSGVLGSIISTTTWILVILAILYQLNIVPDLILTVFVGVVAMVVLALGISFGIGGKDLAKKILEDFEKKVK